MSQWADATSASTTSVLGRHFCFTDTTQGGIRREIPVFDATSSANSTLNHLLEEPEASPSSARTNYVQLSKVHQPSFSMSVARWQVDQALCLEGEGGGYCSREELVNVL